VKVVMNIRISCNSGKFLSGYRSGGLSCSLSSIKLVILGDANYLQSTACFKFAVLTTAVCWKSANVL
jgi:hypothetical protein